MAQPMGLGSFINNDLVFKRKFRWTFSIDGTCGTVDEHFCKIAKRPSWETEQTEVNYMHGKMWIPGKVTLADFEVTYYDVNQDQTTQLLSWLATVYDFTHPVELFMASQQEQYTSTGTLNLYDGCGEIMETWTLLGLWPHNIDLGDLDYASSEVCEIHLTMKYRNVAYESNCPPGQVEPCVCMPC